MILTLGNILDPTSGLALGSILAIAFVLGILHGVTPDEHTWPITFSYAIGSYSTRKGMKSGFIFSSGFTIQRAILTTLGFLGLAAVYKLYNLDGPVYVIVGIAMVVAGAYILNKKRYLHLPLDLLLRGKEHHTEKAQAAIPHELDAKPVPAKMAFVHGLIAGWGFGVYATIITFILAPQVPGLIYAPLVGVCFGLGTMAMQILFGAIFANIARVKKLTNQQLSAVGRRTSGRTLYYGGALFIILGLLILLFPAIDSIALQTGNPIPNLNSIGIATILVFGVVGVIGIGSLILGFREVLRTNVPAQNAMEGLRKT